MYFLSHYSNAAEDTAGRAVSTSQCPQPRCARGWAGALGSCRNLQGCLPHAQSQHGRDMNGLAKTKMDVDRPNCHICC